MQVNGHANSVSKSEAKHQAQQLQDILQQEAEEYLEQRHIIDILQDFSGSHPPLASVLACLRPLQPRLYSISSSQLENPTRVQITVAVVRYNSLGLDRIGVTSTFLKERMQVRVFVPATNNVLSGNTTLHCCCLQCNIMQRLSLLTAIWVVGLLNAFTYQFCA